MNAPLELFTLHQLADACGVCLKTAQEWIQLGKIRPDYITRSEKRRVGYQLFLPQTVEAIAKARGKQG